MALARNPDVMTILSDFWIPTGHQTGFPILTAHDATRLAIDVLSEADVVAHFAAVQPTPKPGNNRARVFVAGFNAALGKHLAELLTESGFETRAFDSRMMAWHAFAFANPQPSVLITNEAEDSMSALELFQQCKAINPNLKTLLVTNRRYAALGRTGRAVVEDVLCEHCPDAQVVGKVARVLDGSRSGWRKFWSTITAL